jgi:2-polyprenyl-3-methyl-5-hydroxy-6-metoxy-1,4-benzoquinol methylase
VAGYIHRLVPRGRILDVGCGEGVLLDYLDVARIDYGGFDISPTAVDRARRHHAGSKVLVGSMDDFEPFNNERYDAIVFNECLSQVRQPIETLHRFYAFLEPDGYIIISQFHNRNPQSGGAIFTRMFCAEIQAARVSVIASSEVLNCDTGLKWTIYCLGGPRAVKTSSPHSAGRAEA